jgi:hypothetical protein
MMAISSILFQTTAVPDTVSYLILGYVIIGGVGLVYVLSLVLRQRKLRRDLLMLEHLVEDDQD